MKYGTLLPTAGLEATFYYWPHTLEHIMIPLFETA